jgi:hypothetical protein
MASKFGATECHFTQVLPPEQRRLGDPSIFSSGAGARRVALKVFEDARHYTVYVLRRRSRSDDTISPFVLGARHLVEILHQ